jgi:hypothetical protein
MQNLEESILNFIILELIKDTVRAPHYIASNDRIMDECLIGKDFKTSRRGLFWILSRKLPG